MAKDRALRFAVSPDELAMVKRLASIGDAPVSQVIRDGLHSLEHYARTGEVNAGLRSWRLKLFEERQNAK